MDLKEALQKLKNSPESEKLSGKNLCSAITFTGKEDKIEKWELNYFNDKTGKVARAVVSQDEIEIFPENELFKKDIVSAIDESTIKITAQEAMKTAKEYNQKNYKQPEQKTFLALHGGKSPFWSVNIITKLMTVIQIKISSSTGKILETKTHNLFKGKGVAG